jgi:hypothetical protein
MYVNNRCESHLHDIPAKAATQDRVVLPAERLCESPQVSRTLSHGAVTHVAGGDGYGPRI